MLLVGRHKPVVARHVAYMFTMASMCRPLSILLFFERADNHGHSHRDVFGATHSP